MSTLVQILNSFNTSQTPRGQELLGHIKEEWQIKMIAVFFFITHEIKRVLFHAQPQTGANSSFHLKASAEMFLQTAFQNKLHIYFDCSNIFHRCCKDHSKAYYCLNGKSPQPLEHCHHH